MSLFVWWKSINYELEATVWSELEATEFEFSLPVWRAWIYEILALSSKTLLYYTIPHTHETQNAGLPSDCPSFEGLSVDKTEKVDGGLNLSSVAT